MLKMLSALAGLSMLGLVGVANAGESVALTDEQMDGVTAGFLNVNWQNYATNTQSTTGAGISCSACGPNTAAKNQNAQNNNGNVTFN